MSSAQLQKTLPSVNEIATGAAKFDADMPVWLARFGDDSWLFYGRESPQFQGKTTSSIVWLDYVNGRGSVHAHINSTHRKRYEPMLNHAIILDLKVTAVIYGFFPKLLKNSKASKAQLDPKTVKSRIEELVRFFSVIISDAKKELSLNIVALSDISFELLKKGIAKYPGLSTHLKGALAVISDPIIQKNLSSPLQWTLLDILKSNLAWKQPKPKIGIQTLSDAQFLFLLEHCKRSVSTIKRILELPIHDSECRALANKQKKVKDKKYKIAIHAYYEIRSEKNVARHFKNKHGIFIEEALAPLKDAHCSAMLLILLLTGMRLSEIQLLEKDSLVEEHGYWFLKSKVIKGRPKETPNTEGWLAVDLTKDAYDVLAFLESKTENKYLFSSVYPQKSMYPLGYKSGVLNKKFMRWLESIDSTGLFSNYNFSVHQCRETLVYQLAKQEVGMPFLSMQLKHFQRQFDTLPNEVTAGYGNYRTQLRTSISSRIADARESALLELYGEEANFAGGGGHAHKARIDSFFSGLELYGESRSEYIKSMARNGVKLMPTSIGTCTKNFILPVSEELPPCYGDYQCDPNCENHVITERCASALAARKTHALAEAEKEQNSSFKVVWLGLAEKLDGHLNKLKEENHNVR